MNEKIIAKIQRLIVQGYSQADVLEWAKKEYPKEKEVALYKKAVACFSDHAMNKVERLGFCLESTRYLFQKMVEVGDYNGALGAVKELAKLSDSYATAKNIGDGKPVGKPKDRKGALLKLIKDTDG